MAPLLPTAAGTFAVDELFLPAVPLVLPLLLPAPAELPDLPPPVAPLLPTAAGTPMPVLLLPPGLVPFMLEALLLPLFPDPPLFEPDDVAAKAIPLLIRKAAPVNTMVFILVFIWVPLSSWLHSALDWREQPHRQIEITRRDRKIDWTDDVLKEN
ncbi:MAG TPA: hypothetical protein VFN77_05820 [Acetobacteraceae bacterium]|nr:hypothetical protein [Acetobacteraceae bacterium]